mmetsp:Transcript_48630/g.109528  ORF Transcript_48630/g.109528 Transcript_48630/m.109528 type:complete len:84 (+) Transcript_48630:338-589(+)
MGADITPAHLTPSPTSPAPSCAELKRAVALMPVGAQRPVSRHHTPPQRWRAFVWAGKTRAEGTVRVALSTSALLPSCARFVEA